MDYDRNDMVIGYIKLPPPRRIGCWFGWLGMRLRVPGSARLYFRSLLGPGVRFKNESIDL